MTDNLDVAIQISEMLRILDNKHFKVIPDKEIIFDGPVNSVCESQLIIENKCNSKVAYIMETSSSERFLITPMIALVEPGEVTTVKILMCPSEANENVSTPIIKMFSVVVMGQVQLSAINKQWMNKQPHNIALEVWKCKFAQDVQAKEALNLPFDMSARQNALGERMQTMRKLRQENEKLRKEVQRCRTLRRMEERAAISRLRLIDVFRICNLQGLFLLFGIDVAELRNREMCLLLLFIASSTFFMGILVGIFLF